MFSITNALFGWMPPLLGLLANAALAIYLAYTVIVVIKFVKDLVSLI